MTKLRVYNTLGRELQEFKPLVDGRVALYYCGPTVYWTQHIGNLRGATCVDVVVRSLEYLGFKVSLVRNYTDVGHLVSDGDTGEDKMEKATKREGVDPDTIANKYIGIYEQDTKELNISEPQWKPRATGHVQEMIEMVQTLVNKGYAYVTPLAVYFDVTKAKDYTKLSGQKLEMNKSGAGSGEISDDGKKNPADFAVWFFRAGAHAKAIQFWPSPFSSPLVQNGEGFPGWHIECSAMSKKYLGPQLDIHMGGLEHIPVHHTNEIAQSEAANGVKYVNYWLHNEHLLVNSGKMAKSEGTSYSLQEIKEKGYRPMHLRYLYLQAHYRSKLNFTWESLDAARSGLDSIYRQVRNLGADVGLINLEMQEKFSECLADDFNTPKALAVLQEVLKSDLDDKDKSATVLDFDRVLGLNFFEVINEKTDISPQALKLARERDEARINKNWSESDRLRLEIENLGFIVEDSKDGTRIVKN
jgi:cysteinyl-tRNA synthetase